MRVGQRDGVLGREAADPGERVDVTALDRGLPGRLRLSPVNSPPVLRIPGSRLTTGIDGSAARTSVRAPMLGCSCAQHHLAADADHVAVDRGRAGGGVPGDRLGDVDRQPALGHRVEPLADLAGRERQRRRSSG